MRLPPRHAVGGKISRGGDGTGGRGVRDRPRRRHGPPPPRGTEVRFPHPGETPRTTGGRGTSSARARATGGIRTGAVPWSTRHSCGPERTPDFWPEPGAADCPSAPGPAGTRPCRESPPAAGERPVRLTGRVPLSATRPARNRCLVPPLWPRPLLVFGVFGAATGRARVQQVAASPVSRAAGTRWSALLRRDGAQRARGGLSAATSSRARILREKEGPGRGSSLSGSRR